MLCIFFGYLCVAMCRDANSAKPYVPCNAKHQYQISNTTSGSTMCQNANCLLKNITVCYNSVKML